jgi:methylthioribulose-1-phosphate dehydratase
MPAIHHPTHQQQTPGGHGCGFSTEQLAGQLTAVMAQIHARGWCDGTGGNFSCVLSPEPLQLLMAPSGVDKGAVAPHELIVVDARSCVCRGEGRASAETLLHLAIVTETGAGAVLHTHSQAGTLLSQHYGPEGDAVSTIRLFDLEMLKGLEGVSTHASEVAVPVLANSQDLAQLSSLARPHLVKAPHGLLIAGHGLYAWGRDLAQAKRHLEILEFLLEQHWRQLLLRSLLR